MGYYNECSMDDPNAEIISNEGWSVDDRPATQLPAGLRIARYDEKGWAYRTPTTTLWVTDAPPLAPTSQPSADPAAILDEPRYYVVQCAICGADLLCNDNSQPRVCASHAQPTITKRIGEYDPETRQYPAYVSIDGEPEQLVGIRWTAGAADQACDEYIFQHYIDNHTPEAAARTPARSAPPTDIPDRLVNQAEALLDRLAAERRRWYGYPVMLARMDKLCTRALARLSRRERKARELLYPA